MTKKNYLTFIYQVELNCYLLWNFNDKVNFLSPEAFCQREMLCFSVSRCLLSLAFVQYFKNILEQSDVTSLFHKWAPGNGKALTVLRSCKVSFPSGNAVQMCFCPLKGTGGLLGGPTLWCEQDGCSPWSLPTSCPGVHSCPGSTPCALPVHQSSIRNIPYPGYQQHRKEKLGPCSILILY